ncbi:MAG: precorrin-6Y C5,15-methyltransferase (decarboxylating), CbiT subunit [Clostridia bacterium]|nr:precorrin-6Y C5,15-methyltransferase (decarboxylating), CbiT subunit [Clostridia bacterium]
MKMSHRNDKVWNYTTPGIPDDLFIRGEVPMTKQEARVITLSRLRLTEDMTVWDIGAGTGSISIEMALQCKRGKVYAIERNPEGIELITKNMEKFQVYNIEVIEGSAPEVLDKLPVPDRIMIGGAGEQLEEILDYSDKVLKVNGLIVTNCITIETVYDTLNWLEKHEYEDIDVVCVSVARAKKVGKRHMFQGLNPIYVISGRKGYAYNLS